jgi:hypothetical protein
MRLKPMKTYAVTLDPEVWELLRSESEARLVPVTDLCRIAIGKWLVSHSRLKQEQLTPAGRLVPEGRQRPPKRKRVRKGAVEEGNVAVLYDDTGDAAE